MEVWLELVCVAGRWSLSREGRRQGERGVQVVGSVVVVLLGEVQSCWAWLESRRRQRRKECSRYTCRKWYLISH